VKIKAGKFACCVLGQGKRRSQSEGRGGPVRTSGVLQIRTFAFFDAKNIEFFKIYSVSARIKGEGRGLSQCGHFSDKGGKWGGINFSRFCADVLYGPHDKGMFKSLMTVFWAILDLLLSYAHNWLFHPPPPPTHTHTYIYHK